MSPQHTRFATVLNRIASATNVLRTRTQEETRQGRSAEKRFARMDGVINQLERIADELESSI